MIKLIMLYFISGLILVPWGFLHSIANPHGENILFWILYLAAGLTTVHWAWASIERRLMMPKKPKRSKGY